MPRISLDAINDRLRFICHKEELTISPKDIQLLIHSCNFDVRACIHALQFTRSSGPKYASLTKAKDTKKSDFFIWNATFRHQNYAEYKSTLALHSDFDTVLVGIFELYIQAINSSLKPSAVCMSNPIFHVIARVFCDANHLQTRFLHNCSTLDWYCASAMLGLNKRFSSLGICSNQSFSITEYPRADFLCSKTFRENHGTLINCASSLNCPIPSAFIVTELLPALSKLASLSNTDINAWFHKCMRTGHQNRSDESCYHDINHLYTFSQ